VALNVKIVGGGPAGLYLACLLKRSDTARIVRVLEQNPADATFGFGVVFSGQGLRYIAEGASALVDAMTAEMEIWSDQIIDLKGEKIVIDGSEFAAIERLSLLQMLQKICCDVGVDIQFNTHIDRENIATDCDLLVGADGANSVVRDTWADKFGTQSNTLKNFFAWYGVETTYPSHTLTFRDFKDGGFCGHHYRYTPIKSTFVAECDALGWERAGFADMDDDQRQVFTEELFRDTLHGLPLLNNRSIWRNWSMIKNDTWFYQNVVLIGDALRTAHPSIGSGTRLAMEDSIFLWKAIEAHSDDIAAALPTYQATREPIRSKLNTAGEKSIAWYEDMSARIKQPPYDFAYDYLMRTERVTEERLESESPDFVARYRQGTAREFS
jgi:2-polyprenyl-6-methoxyphenol hydroxylase-like FAD-dependent oxidoreductase